MFTIGKQIKLLDDLYKEQKYEEVVNKCSEFITLTDKDNRDNWLSLFEFYSRMFNAYFRLSNKEKCHFALDECRRYAETDFNAHITDFNRMRLYIVTNEKLDEAHEIIERLLEYWEDTNDIKRYAKTLNWKGELTKNYKYFKEAHKIFQSLKEDTAYDQEVALKGIKKYRHLK